MEFSCSACSQVLLIGPEHYGQVVQCPHCHEMVDIPASPVPAAAPGTKPTKPCPYCGEAILKVARRCKFCKNDIPEGFDPDSAALRLQAKEPLIAQQAAAAQRQLPYSVRGRFQWSTIVFAGLTPICIIAAVIGFSANQRDALFILGPLGLIIGMTLLVVTLVMGVRDLLAVKYFGRDTPEKGAKAFWGGLCAKRYLFAYHCLLDADKDQTPRLRPPLAKLGVEAELFSFDQFAGFCNYWKNLLHKRRSQAAIKKIQLVRIDGDVAEVSATLKLTQHSTMGFLALGALGAMLFANRETLAVKKLFRRVNGQWYAVNGEFDSGEDRFGFTCGTLEPVEAELIDDTGK